ncbi:MAG: YhbY family RNA-binding protein [Promethearchaeota archaeon]
MDYQDKFKQVLLASPHCNLGKKGITDEFLSHVGKLLKRYKIIKIRALKTVANKSTIRQIAKEISELTGSRVLDVRGKKIILGKYKI